MAKTIYILRHAKAAGALDYHNDHVRPLTEDGIEAAGRVGTWLASHHFIPQHVLSSNAKRTRETWEHMAPLLNPKPSVEFTERLYLATAGEIFQCVNDVEDSVSSLMVIGHNPGIHQFALLLTRSGDDQAIQQLQHKFPPAALAVIKLDVPRWRAVDPACGDLTHCLFAKHLPAD